MDHSASCRPPPPRHGIPNAHPGTSEPAPCSTGRRASVGPWYLHGARRDFAAQHVQPPIPAHLRKLQSDNTGRFGPAMGGICARVPLYKYPHENLCRIFRGLSAGTPVPQLRDSCAQTGRLAGPIAHHSGLNLRHAQRDTVAPWVQTWVQTWVQAALPERIKP